MIVLDTTVLVYAKGVDHPLRDPCRDLVAAVAEGTLEATTTAEVIQEFAHVRARRRDRADAAARSREYLELLSPLISASSDELMEGLMLFERSQQLGCFDAVLAASAAACGATALVSADVAFGTVQTLRHVVPDRDGVATLLAQSS